MSIFFIALASVLAVTMIILVGFAVGREKKIQKSGIEVDSVVVKSESYFRNHEMRYRNYVKYIGDDRTEHEGFLNVSMDMPIGRKVRVKFLPGKYDYVIFVSQEL